MKEKYQAPAEKTAIATPAGSTTLYDVTYPGAVDLDSKVPYAYLQLLASRGYTVRVKAMSDRPAHIIRPVPER